MNTSRRILVSILLAALWLGMSVGAAYHFHLDGAYHHDCPECNFQKNLFSANLQQVVAVPIHYICIQQLVESVPQIPVCFLTLSFPIRPPPCANQ